MSIVEKRELRREEELPKADLPLIALDRLENGVFWFDPEGRVAYANDAACRLLECSREGLLVCRVVDFAPDSNGGWWGNIWQKARAFGTHSLEALFRSGSGRVFPVEVKASYYVRGQDELICVVVREVSSAGQTAELVRLAEAIYTASHVAVMVMDERNRIVQVNPAFTLTTDYVLDELYGKNPSVLRSGVHDEAFYKGIWKDINEAGYWQGEMWNRRRDGELFASHVTISRIRNEDGSIFRYVAQFVEITEKKRQDEKIWQYANYDTLTELPNRRLFQDRLAQEIKKSNRTGHPLALLFIDLDGFKQINDSLGHDMGDLLLIEAARRIEKCLRETDTVARFGGDEFTIILPSYGDCVDVERIAQSIIRKLQEPFYMEGRQGSVSASIGIASYPGDAREVDELLKYADQAMYEAKKQGRNRFSYVTEPRPLKEARNSYLERRAMYFGNLKNKPSQFSQC